MELLLRPLCQRGMLIQTRSHIGLRDGVRWGPKLLKPSTLGGRGDAVPRSATSEVLTSGAFWTASFAPPRPGEVLRDNTSVSSMAVGEGARDDASLSSCSGGREFPSDEGVFKISWGGLQSQK